MCARERESVREREREREREVGQFARVHIICVVKYAPSLYQFSSTSVRSHGGVPVATKAARPPTHDLKQGICS